MLLETTPYQPWQKCAINKLQLEVEAVIIHPKTSVLDNSPLYGKFMFACLCTNLDHKLSRPESDSISDSYCMSRYL